MIEKAYGKINLSLDVVSRREDGYHNLKSIMLPINIYDVIDIELADERGAFPGCPEASTFS